MEVSPITSGCLGIRLLETADCEKPWITSAEDPNPGNWNFVDLNTACMEGFVLCFETITEIVRDTVLCFA